MSDQTTIDRAYVKDSPERGLAWSSDGEGQIQFGQQRG